MHKCLFLLAAVLPFSHAFARDAKQAGDEELARLVKVTGPEVKGAHDAALVMAGDLAYIVAEVNEVRPGENPEWPEIYVALSIVNSKTMKVEQVLPVVRGGQVFDNTTLPAGACFVPRLLLLNPKTLRLYFASEEPKRRQAQTWYLDFDLETRRFENTLHKVKLKTAAGTFDMQPQFFHADAVAHGFTRPAVDYGLYLFDAFKEIDGRLYVGLNNYPGGQNALGVANAGRDTFEVLGHYDEPFDRKYTESAFNRLPDGTWMAVCRREDGDHNYGFSTSSDGRRWSPLEPRPFVPNGAASKPTFDRFGGLYYLGWQEATKVGGVNRSVFNLDVSKDGVMWERRYRFETEKSFQYPVFVEHNGSIWLAVTQGDADATRKERIMFGKLE